MRDLESDMAGSGDAVTVEYVSNSSGNQVTKTGRLVEDGLTQLIETDDGMRLRIGMNGRVTSLDPSGHRKIGKRASVTGR